MSEGSAAVAAPTPPLLWAPWAWVAGRWQAAVQLRCDAAGRWAAVECGVPPAPQAQVLDGPVLPGLVNAHSHAFQRAFAGLAERRDSASDDFWSWRDRMYRVALRVGPEALRAVAAHLYGELLAGGYTEVCEFHYLHHRPDGQPYEEPATMALALAAAAEDAGIGLTLLPVLYERAGFTEGALRADQRRFASTPATVLALRDAVRAHARARAHSAAPLQAGVAVHSLRAARPASLHALAEACGGDAAPVHIHIAEQQAEVAACLTATGQRPIEWLLGQGLLDARWHLVHATHAAAWEMDGIAASGAGVVLCPTTEANLGDGLTDVPAWLASGVPLALGSDSHVTRQWPEELRWLEYGQRLHLQARNVAADPGREASTAARLFNRTLAGGAAAAGFSRWGLQVGARADLLVLDTDEPALAGLPPSHLLDGVVFAAAAQPFRAVMVAGRWRALHDAGRRAAYADAMRELWQDADR